MGDDPGPGSKGCHKSQQKVAGNHCSRGDPLAPLPCRARTGKRIAAPGRLNKNAHLPEGVVLDIPAGKIARPIITVEEGASIVDASKVMVENDRGSVGVAAFEIVEAQTVDIDETPDRRVASLRALRDDDNDDRGEEAADKNNQDENFDEGHGGAMTSLCAGHVRQLGGASPPPNLMEVKG